MDLRCLFLPAPVDTVQDAWLRYQQEKRRSNTAPRKKRRAGVLSVVPAEGGCYLVAATEKEHSLARRLGLRKQGLTERDLRLLYDRVLSMA